MVQTVNAPPGEATRARHFAFHYASWLLHPFRLVPGAVERSGIEVDDLEVRVCMSPGVEVVIPRSSITRVWQPRADEEGIAFCLRLPVGIHTNFRGSWWMNGSSHNLVAIDLDPPVGGRVWAIPVRPRRVVVSLENPEGFIAEVLG